MLRPEFDIIAELVAERDRARAIAVALEGQVAALERVMNAGPPPITDYSGWSVEQMVAEVEATMAERDEALAAVERVRALAERPNSWWFTFTSDALASLRAALGERP